MFRSGFYQRFITVLGFVSLFLASPLALSAQTTRTEQAPPDLTRPTVLSRTVTPAGAPSIDTSTIPAVGMTGILVETLDGQMVMEQLGNIGFNPASAVKLATALAALRTFGPEHRFTTAVWTNGTIDKQTGTINGDLIISGRDPSFHYEHAVMLARELNRMGIRTVTGDLIVAPRFTMNFSLSAQRSGDALYDTLDASRRPVAAAHAWTDERIALGDNASLQTLPSVAVMGAVYVDSVPKGARPLLTHNSSKLVDVLKVLLCYSNNFMAERIGDTLGGPEGVRRVAIRDAGVNPAEISLATTSGLGVNRVTPRAMMKIFRALRSELAKTNLSPSDIMPVAGVDPGTLHKRYTSYPSRGSVIAKTGTLIRTDGGVSALVGQMKTARNETLLFVIFNQRGSFLRFREAQDVLVTQLQNQRGGPAAFDYRPLTLSMRLADTEQSAVTSLSDEYEPGTR
ncbi:MAG TPA: D-alanyl-D-alanine carboxypeptidase [Pyrinomonadaceae bacterium]|nr:D-alanyl-D-alanine carboxypeptidase [Pyrinomonadaceae bacterium]